MCVRVCICLHVMLVYKCVCIFCICMFVCVHKSALLFFSFLQRVHICKQITLITIVLSSHAVVL